MVHYAQSCYESLNEMSTGVRTVPTAAFTTLGCKVNQYETQRILDDFEERGFAITEFNTPADVYVINTCSVTQAAERKSRYMIRKVARQNPDAIVVMTGCYGEMAKIKGEAVEDAALVLNVLAGYDARDPACQDQPVPDFSRGLRRGVRRLRIGVIDNHFMDRNAPEVQACIEARLADLQREGAVVSHFSMPILEYGLAAIYAIELV